MRKKDLWHDIANQLMSEGFNFKNKPDAWAKVSQKWRNLERTYRVHLHQLAAQQQRNNKGGDSKNNKPLRSKTPDFFDDLRQLLCNKYRIVNGTVVTQKEIPEDGDGRHPQMTMADADGSATEEEEEYEAEYEIEHEGEENSDEIVMDPGPESSYLPEAFDVEEYEEDQQRPTSTDASVMEEDKTGLFASLSDDPSSATIRLLLEMR